MVYCMIRKTLPWLLMLAFVLSGCLGDSEDVENDGEGSGTEGDGNTGDGANGEGDGDGGSGGSNGGTGGDTNETGEPLSASLDANVTEGNAPLTVSFDLNATGGDDGSLSWSFLVGEDEADSGEELPTTIEYTFEEAGNHSVVLNVTYGAETAEANVTITVTEVVAGPNEAQSGSGGDCLDYVALWAINADPAPGGVHSPLGSDQIEVDPGTDWEATSDEGTPWVDFFDENGYWMEESTSGSGTVPESAAYALACVTESGGWPDVFVPLGEWTYQDGF